MPEATTRARAQQLLSAAALAAATVVIGAGCTPRPVLSPRRLAIVPVDTLGVPPTEATTLERGLLREARRRPTVRAASTDEVRRAMRQVQSPGGRCVDRDGCLAALGRRVPADLVLSTTLAGLGEMRLVRARLLRARDGLLLQDLQQTIPGGARALHRTAADIARRLFPAPAGGAPWYRRWWVWSAAAVIAGSAVAVTWALAARDSPPARDPSVIHVGDL